MKKNLVLIFSIIIFLLAFCLRTYYISQKTGLHIDEMLTNSVTSCQYGQNLSYPINNGIVYSGKDLKREFTYQKVSLNSSVKDFKKIWLDDCGDYAHPDLYYLIFKTFTYPVKQLNFKTLVHYGCGLNLIIFCFSFVLLYKLLSNLFEDNLEVVPLGLAVAFLNTGALSSTILVRMYELQIFAAIAIVYSVVLLCQELENGQNIFSFKKMSFFIFSGLVCILSGYFMVTFFLFITFFLAKKIYYREGKQGLLQFSFVLCLIGILVFLLYPGFLKGLQDRRSFEINSMLLSGQFFVSLHNSFFAFISNYKFFLFYLPVILLCIPCLFFYQKCKNTNLIISLILLVFVWSILITILSPEKMSRYIVPGFAIVGMIVPLSVSFLTGAKKYFLNVVLILMYLYFAIAAKPTEWDFYVKELDGYKFYSKNYDWSSSHIENLYRNDPEFAKHPEFPVVFLCSGFWNYINLIYYFNDDQKYIFYSYTAYKEGPEQAIVDSILKTVSKYKKYYLFNSQNYFDLHSGLFFENKIYPSIELSRLKIYESSIVSKERVNAVDIYLIENK